MGSIVSYSSCACALSPNLKIDKIDSGVKNACKLTLPELGASPEHRVLAETNSGCTTDDTINMNATAKAQLLLME